MVKIPDNILVHYGAIIIKKGLAVSVHSNYKKWLWQTPMSDSKSDRVHLFIEKLWKKKQTPVDGRVSDLMTFGNGVMKLATSTPPGYRTNLYVRI